MKQSTLGYLLAALLLPFSGLAQTTTPTALKPTVRDVDANAQSRIEEINLPPAPVKGTFYWSESWQGGNITFTSGKLVDNLLLRYDLENQTVEVNVDGDIRAAFPQQLSRFRLHDGRGQHTFVNTRLFSPSLPVPKGYFELLVDGKITLLKHYSAKVKKANYVAALDMGRRSDEIIQEEQYYVSTPDQLIELSPSRKKSLEALRQVDAQLESFIKKHRLSFREEADLIRIVQHLNDRLFPTN